MLEDRREDCSGSIPSIRTSVSRLIHNVSWETRVKFICDKLGMCDICFSLRGILERVVVRLENTNNIRSRGFLIMKIVWLYIWVLSSIIINSLSLSQVTCVYVHVPIYVCMCIYVVTTR